MHRVKILCPIRKAGRYLMKNSEHYLMGSTENLGWKVLQGGAAIIGRLHL